MAEFAFATCLPGIEPAVKREVARTRPDLRFAYSRPGLITFKANGGVTPDDPAGSAFARVWGRSIGAAREPLDAIAQLTAARVDRIHIYPREPADTDSADELAAAEALLAPWREQLHGTAPIDGAAAPGELVGDVIVAPPGEAAWLGLHRHRTDLPPDPGGVRPAQVPAASPSRAYAKIEEAIAWTQLPVAAGQVALEIGAAPGGAVLALAERGLDVWAVDTGDLAADIAARESVHHLAKKVGAVRWEELPPKVDWLLVDVNLAPQVALHEVARLMPHLRSSLRGAVITLKMNDWAFVDELPKLVARIAELGLPDVRLRHLPSNRREICAVARPR